MSSGVTFRNEPWHRECFGCTNCNRSLAGQRFATHDANQKETTTTANSNGNKPSHNAYCIDCYGQLFAKKCFACEKGIFAIGGTRFVSFEDRSWHNECFVCFECQGSLIGKGFISDGPDIILCGDCACARIARPNASAPASNTATAAAANDNASDTNDV